MKIQVVFASLLAFSGLASQAVAIPEGATTEGSVTSNPITESAPTESTPPESVAAPAEAPVASAAVENFESRYRIGNNDVISIRVFNEPELSREKVRLNEAGFIQYIALGEFKVLGLTTREVEEIVTKALLGNYLKNPRVTVSVDEYRPYFVSGEVGKRGSYPYQPGMTVLRAITIAGGFSARAAENKIFIRRESEPGVKIKVEADSPIEPGDIITVEESFF